MTVLLSMLGVLVLLAGVWAIDAIWDLLHPEDMGEVSDRTRRRYRNDRW